MLHHNWVVIKVAFGSVKKHIVGHSQSRWDRFAPLYKSEISPGPSSDSDQEMHGHAGVKS